MYLEDIFSSKGAQLPRLQLQAAGGAVQQLNVRRRFPVLNEKTAERSFCLRNFQIGRKQVRNGADYRLIGGDVVEDGVQRNEGLTDEGGQHKKVNLLGAAPFRKAEVQQGVDVVGKVEKEVGGKIVGDDLSAVVQQGEGGGGVSLPEGRQQADRLLEEAVAPVGRDYFL